MAAKKTKVTKKAVKKKTCSVKGCRRVARTGTLCEKCAAETPVEAATKVSLLEAQRWHGLDLELRNTLQGIQLIERESTIAQQQFNQQQFKRNADKTELVKHANAIKARYIAMTKEIADQFGYKSDQITIDPDTGLVREIESS